jgi:hypothetical protein
MKNVSLRIGMKRAVDNEQRRKQKQPETAQIRLQRPFIGLTRWGKQRNVDIRNKLSHDSIVDEIRNVSYKIGSKT